MAGLNASAIYPGQADNKHQFDDWATQDIDGKPVTHPEYKQPKYLAALKTAPQGRGDTGAGRLAPPVMQRASLANPRFRDRLMKIMEAQIDAGADGIVLAESDALGYRANADKQYNGDEGYDPFMLEGFNQYLRDKYVDYQEANWEIQYGMSLSNTVAVRLPWEPERPDFDPAATSTSAAGRTTPATARASRTGPWRLNGATFPTRPPARRARAIWPRAWPFTRSR
jgi:hypothetical protein